MCLLFNKANRRSNQKGGGVLIENFQVQIINVNDEFLLFNPSNHDGNYTLIKKLKAFEKVKIQAKKFNAANTKIVTELTKNLEDTVLTEMQKFKV